MMKKSQIALAVAAAFGVTSAQAGVITGLTFVSEVGESANGSSQDNIASTTATWSYDTATDILSGTGLYSSASQIIPIPGQLFTRNISDLTVGNGGAAAATAYSCIEGSFGGGVGASLCGNYNFGANFLQESTNSWGPGTAFSQTVGGDDVSIGPQQSLAQHDGMFGNWNGTTLVMTNAITGVSGYDMIFVKVPVPAAVWLFGSALGLLGWARRRATT
jgi:hypothetical protein